MSPEKKRLKIGKKISPKHSRKKTIKQNSGTPELQKLFKRMNEKKSLPPKEIVENKEIKFEEKELKRKQSVLDLMKKFENIEKIPATPQKERKIMTPKRRIKKESIPKEEERKEKKSVEKERFGTMSQNSEDLASEGLMSSHKSQEVEPLGLLKRRKKSVQNQFFQYILMPIDQ